MYCPKCGHENNDENRFCMSCGLLFNQSPEFNKQEQTIQNVRTQNISKRNSIVIGIIAAIVAVVIGGVLIYEIVGKSTQNSDDFIAISNAQVSDTVRFGKYEWYVIDKWSNYCTLLCKDVVAEKPYKMFYDDKNESDWVATRWENSTLREWLNNDFYNEFNDDEKNRIELTQCINSNNYKTGTDGGNDTEDKIYLLSLDEVEMLDANIRKCSKWWWLRSPGEWQDYAAGVHWFGRIHYNGSCIDIELGVRPAITIKIN